MKKYLNNPYLYAGIVLALFIFRIVLNTHIPLMDETEARYAEVARIMYETGNWISPQINYDVPFWAKPPLSTWLSAASFKLFGVTEFAARLPYLLLSMAMVLFCGKYARRLGLPFFLPGMILITLPEFIIHAGVVSTDTALAFCVMLVMLSFWESVKSPTKNIWNYLLFVGIGLGLLAKGPIILILTIPPLFVWTLYYKKALLVWNKIPWIIGALLSLAIAVPWYYLAELKTPGFIDYFIVGEHFKRFVDSSWSGDKYGFPKSQPLGMVWVFLFAFALPWIQVIIFKIWKKRKIIFKNEWEIFLILWLLWTPLFFTVSSSLIHPYIMPVMVPVALLICSWWQEIKRKLSLLYTAIAFPVMACGFYIFVCANNLLVPNINSDKYLVVDQLDKTASLYYWKWLSFSGQFYSDGQMQKIKTKALREKIAKDEDFLIIIPHKDLYQFSDTFMNRVTLLETHSKKSLYAYRVDPKLTSLKDYKVPLIINQKNEN